MNVRKVRRNILLGKNVDRSENKKERWKIVTLVALGQKKMFSRPFPALMHLFVYVGFVLINIEVLEMIIDGVLGTHRVFSFLNFEGFHVYNLMIGSFEILAFLVTLGCIVFLIRRNIVNVKRLVMKELNGWPRSDANIILISEILIMTSLFLMNGADQTIHVEKLAWANFQQFPISSFFVPAFYRLDYDTLVILEQSC